MHDGWRGWEGRAVTRGDGPACWWHSSALLGKPHGAGIRLLGRLTCLEHTARQGTGPPLLSSSGLGGGGGHLLSGAQGRSAVKVGRWPQ